MKKYIKHIVNPSPTKLWQVTRFVLHWVTLPIKLVIMSLIGIFGIIYNKVRYTKRQIYPQHLNLQDRSKRLQKVLKYLPVLKNEFYNLYLPRNELGDTLDGTNHSSDHQLLQHGRYVFLMSKINRQTPQMIYALEQFLHNKMLARGYKWDYEQNKFIHNFRSVSGDMLLGLCLSLLSAKDNEDFDLLLEKFDILMAGIVQNDYALLEGQLPTDEPYKSIYQELGLNPKMKSSRAMWQPGAETTGAQALTILAALKVNHKINRTLSSGREYNKLFFKYGYGLLSLIPTCYLPKRRGYFNDCNCIQALYILLKLSDTKLEKFVYKFALRYVFNLSKSWYNLYFIGLIKEVAPELLDEKYLNTAKDFLYESEPVVFTADNAKTTQIFKAPIPIDLVNHSEFAFQDKLDHVKIADTGDVVHSGLSELAAMVLLDDELVKSFNEPKSFN